MTAHALDLPVQPFQTSSFLVLCVNHPAHPLLTWAEMQRLLGAKSFQEEMVKTGSVHPGLSLWIKSVPAPGAQSFRAVHK